MDIVDRLVTRLEMQGAASVVRSLADVGDQMENIGTLVGGSLLVSGMIAFGRSIVQTQLKVEKLNAQLHGLFGRNAPAEMGFLDAIAEQTHQRVEDVRDAAIELANRGLRPSGRLMTDIARLALQSGRDMKDVAAAIDKATHGNTRGLREFGIVMKDAKGNAVGLEEVLGKVEKRLGSSANDMGELTRRLNDFHNEWEKTKQQFVNAPGGGPLGWAAKFAADTLRVFRGGEHAEDFQRLAGERLALRTLEGRFRNMPEGPEKERWRTRLFHLRTQVANDEALIRNPDPSHRIGPALQAFGQNGEGGIGQIIRQIVGSGEIGRLGIRPSELPGMQPARKKDLNLNIQLSPKDTMEDIIRKVLADANRHGFSLQPNPS